MDAKVYTINPDPDTVIILTNPVQDFAPWDGDAQSLIATSGAAENTSSEASKMIEGTSVNQNADTDTEANEHEATREIRYYVSSQHLKLASPWFKRAMSEYKESQKDPEDDLYHVNAEDWDEKAFLRVLRAMHGLFRQVPDYYIGSEGCAKVAVIVDYYELAKAEIMGNMFATWQCDLWLEKPVYFESSQEYLRCKTLKLCVAWVHRHAIGFRQSTHDLLMYSDSWIETCGLPIPQRIIDRIDLQRNTTLERIVSGLNLLLKGFQSHSYVCPTDPTFSAECGAYLGGALARILEDWNVLSPPQAPFHGWSLSKFQALSGGVQELKRPIFESDASGSPHRVSRVDLDSSLGDSSPSSRISMDSLKTLQRLKDRGAPVSVNKYGSRSSPGRIGRPLTRENRERSERHACVLKEKINETVLKALEEARKPGISLAEFT